MKIEYSFPKKNNKTKKIQHKRLWSALAHVFFIFDFEDLYSGHSDAVGALWFLRLSMFFAVEIE